MNAHVWLTYRDWQHLDDQKAPLKLPDFLAQQFCFTLLYFTWSIVDPQYHWVGWKVCSASWICSSIKFFMKIKRVKWNEKNLKRKKGFGQYFGDSWTWGFHSLVAASRFWPSYDLTQDADLHVPQCGRDAGKPCSSSLLRKKEKSFFLETKSCSYSNMKITLWH